MDHDSGEARSALDSLKTARGLVEGIIRMVETDRYCIEVSKQVLACIALLKKANRGILARHMNTCVREAVQSGEGEAKVTEITRLLETYLEG